MRHGASCSQSADAAMISQALFNIRAVPRRGLSCHAGGDEHRHLAKHVRRTGRGWTHACTREDRPPLRVTSDAALREQWGLLRPGDWWAERRPVERRLNDQPTISET